LIVRSDCQINGVWNLRRHVVKGQCRDKANDTSWNFEGDRNEIWVFKRLSIGNPVETAIQPLQELIVSKRIERPRMYPQLHCPLCLEHATIRSENA
jgi:hypothetical protein